LSPKERGEEVLAIIESAGICLSRNGNKIVARPSDLVTEAAASTIKNYKEELLEALRRRDGHGGRAEQQEIERAIKEAGYVVSRRSVRTDYPRG